MGTKKKKGVQSEAISAEAPAPLAYEPRREEIHVERLVRSPLNPRTIRVAGDEAKIEELAASIARKGVLDDLLVRETADGFFEILAGDSRWRAAQRAMIEVPSRATVPCKVYPADLPDDEALEIAIESNDHRSDPHPLDQCAAFVRLRDEHHRTVEQIAARVGRTTQHVYDRLRLEQLGEHGRQALIDGRIALTVALILARIVSTDTQERVLNDLLRQYPDGVPIQAAREAAKMRLMVIASAPFDVGDPELVPAAGNCIACRKRSDAQVQLFGDLLEDGGEARCTDPECWDAKRQTSWERATAGAVEEGKRVADDKLQEKILSKTWGGLAAGYERLDDICHVGTGTKTWRQEIGSKRLAEIEVVVIRDRDGRAVDVARREDMLPLLPKAKPTKAAPEEVSEYEIVRRVVGALGLQLATKLRRELKISHALGRSLARVLLESASDVGGDDHIREVTTRLGAVQPDAVSENAVELLDRVAAWMERQSGPQALAVALEVLVRAKVRAPERGSAPELLGALKLDVRALRRDALKAAKAAAKKSGKRA
jgi:ParB/RepB/Spo0J family partition protein